jgi:hypothetical protein
MTNHSFVKIFGLFRFYHGYISVRRFAHSGTLLEPLVKKFSERMGLKVRAKKMLLQSRENPFMLANLDGVLYNDSQLAQKYRLPKANFSAFAICSGFRMRS